MRDRYYRIARWVTVPPQGLSFIAAVLEKKGLSVKIIDSVALKMTAEETAAEIVKLRPRWLGLTGPTMVIRSAADISERVKNAIPDVKTVIGGPHLSAAPEETFERYKTFDIGVIGEGEITAEELFTSTGSPSDLANISGLLLRDNGKAVRTECRPLIGNLDSIPFPAYHLLPDLAKFYQHVVVRVDRMPSASVLISRGCTKGKCTFCSRDVYGGRSRIHSAEYAVALFEKLMSDYGVRSLNFEDEDLLAFKPVMRRICEIMLEKKLDLTWAISGRVDMVDQDLLALMKKAGCWNVSYGIESGSQTILDNIKKGITIEQVRKAVEVTRRAGMTTKGFFMIGHPGETADTIQATIDFAKSLPLDYFQMSYTAPLPGTELYRTAKQWGEFNADWEELNIWNPIFIPHGLSREILEKESLRAFREFYFRPRILWDNFKRTLKTRYILTYLRDGLRFLGFLRSG